MINLFLWAFGTSCFVVGIALFAIGTLEKRERIAIQKETLKLNEEYEKRMKKAREDGRPPPPRPPFEL